MVFLPQEWKKYSKNDVAAGLQSFLICIEMFVAALAHAYAFPPSDYTDPLHPPHGMVSFRIIGEHALCASHALSDARACTGSMQQ